MRTNPYLGSLKIAFTCSGTFIGAGFASGQEFLQFFIAYGSIALASLLFSGILFYLFSRRLLHISYKHRLYSQTDLLNYLFTPKTAAGVDFILSFFLFTVLIIMLAGAGTLAADLFYIDSQYGSLALLLMIIIAASPGFQGITKINMVITPILITSILLVSLHSLTYHGIDGIQAQEAYYAYQAVPTWILASFLYVSYNLILSITILTPLGGKALESSSLKYGSTLSSLILTVLSILIAAVLLAHCPNILSASLPMLEISCSQSMLHTALYSSTLLAAMFTTSLSCLYGCATKCTASLPFNYITNLCFIGAAAGCFSHIGFSRLIAVLFPAFGFLGFAVLYKLATTNKSI